MSPDLEMVRKHVRRLVEEAGQRGVPEDVVGRMIVQEAVEIWKRKRSLGDIANELEFIASHLDPDTDFEFMRP